MRITFKLTATVAAVLLFTSLSACTSPTTAPSASNPAPTVAPTSAPATSASPSQTATLTLGPLGYGTLKLGATKAEARATGLTQGVSSSSKGACGADSDGWLKGAPTPSDDSEDGRLFFSANTGKLITISAYGQIATPEGIKLGSTVKELKAAYKDWSSIESDDDNNGRGYANVSGNKKAVYRIVTDAGKVIELSLESDAQDCYE